MVQRQVEQSSLDPNSTTCPKAAMLAIMTTEKKQLPDWAVAVKYRPPMPFGWLSGGFGGITSGVVQTCPNPVIG